MDETSWVRTAATIVRRDRCDTINARRARLADSFVEFQKHVSAQSIADRFELVVTHYADRIAVKTKTHTLTYGALNAAANRVAHAILAAGTRTELPIALFLDHDAPMIAAILGVLKAGNSYVPVDPAFPPQRTSHILADSQAGLIITDRKNALSAEKVTRRLIPLLNIDEFDSSLSIENPRVPVSPDAIAYILYTSGSTGKPKGVLQNHRNVLHDVTEYSNTLCISPDDRMTLLYSYSVNGSVRGIFGALFNAAALYPLDVRKEGLGALATLMVEEDVTFYHSVPSVFRAFVAGLTGNEKFASLRVIRFGGERVLSRDVDLYKAHFPDRCILYTGMGATETGQIREYFIDKNTQLPGNVVPTGYAVDDKEVLLLDNDGREVGINCVGEIAVKSRYLSPGYWGKPELTWAAFSCDPLDPSMRIYRTGDLGRMRSDGCLEHLGRKDFQSKTRGYRVELAEIETALLDFRGIKDAVVLARQDGPGDEQLVGYVVVTTEPAPRVSDLRGFLKDRLPDYMVPSAFVVLDAMPLTPNGKVDRLALPAPGHRRPESGTPFASAESPLESRLTQIWENVLGVQPVGATDNFFDLGGHSLRAIELIGQIERAFGRRLAPAILFQTPTIRQLAGVLRQAEWPDTWSSLVPVQRGGSKTPFFWVHGDSSNAFLAHYLGLDQPLYGLEHQSQDGSPARWTEVETIAAEYIKEIRSVQQKGPYCLGGYSFGGIIAFEMAQQLKAQGDDVPVLFLLDSHYPGNSTDSHEPGTARGCQQPLGSLRRRVRQGIYAVHGAVKRNVCEVCVAIGRPLPVSLRSFYVLGVYGQARSRYVPRPYPGRAMYVNCDQRADVYSRNWRSLMRDGMEQLEIAGDHADMIKEPAARVWSEPLRKWLGNCVSPIAARLDRQRCSGPVNRS